MEEEIEKQMNDIPEMESGKLICNGLHCILSAPRAYSNWSLRTGQLGLSGKACTARSESYGPTVQTDSPPLQVGSVNRLAGAT